MINVLAIFKAPAPYFSPLFRLFSGLPNINLEVVYCLRTTEDGIHYVNYETGKTMSWGVSVLDGYNYTFIDNRVRPCGLPEHKVVSRGIVNIINDRSIDIILLGTSYWSLTTWYAIKEAKKRHIPIVTRATVQTTKKRRKGLLAIKEVVVGQYCKNMTAGVYECRDQKEYLIHYGMNSDSLFYAPCSVDNAFFSNLSQQNDKYKLRSELNIPSDKIVMVTTGRIVSVKRPWDLVNAYEMLKRDGYNVDLFFVGDGPLKDDLESYCLKNELNGIHFTGNVTQSEVCRYLSMSDIFILPSDSDASPKSLNEAMNFALPIVITHGVSTAPELLYDGVNGYIYEPGDVNALVEAIRKIISNDSFKRMGEESLRIVSENGYERVISGWNEAIEYSLNLKNKK